jgi:TonB family protein
MRTTALILCCDEKVVEAVTQTLSELEVAAEPVRDADTAVKCLAGQIYDLVIVDCDREQDATRLFTAVRNSESNHGAMTVAVINGKAGVALAFRLGAGMVITKPVSLEQTRSTLRTAIAMHKKSNPSAKAPVVPFTPAVPPPSVEPASVRETTSDILPKASTSDSDTQPSIAKATGAQTRPAAKPGLTFMMPPASDARVPEDQPAEKKASKVVKKATTPVVPENSGYPLPAETFAHKSPKTGASSALIFVLVLAILGGGGYVAYLRVRLFHTLVAAEYSMVHAKVVGSKPASLAARPVTPAQVAVKPAPVPKPAVPPDGFVADAPQLAQAESATPANDTTQQPVILAASATSTVAEEPAPITVPDDLANEHLVARVEPVYPAALRRKGVRGDVVLQALVAKDGTVESLSVINGNPQLAAAAMDAVKQWRYESYLHNGAPAIFQTNVTVSFETSPKTSQ